MGPSALYIFRSAERSLLIFQRVGGISKISIKSVFSKVLKQYPRLSNSIFSSIKLMKVTDGIKPFQYSA